jgi:heptosyltransferase-1
MGTVSVSNIHQVQGQERKSMSADGAVKREKILVVRAGRGGDLIMITPALDALLQARPEAEIHLLTTADGRRILRGYDPRLTCTHVYTRRFPRTLLVQRELTPRLQAEDFTSIYIFETKSHYRSWLGGMAPSVFALSGDASRGHYADRCLDLVAGSLDTPVSRGHVRLPVSEEGKTKARQLLAAHGVDPAAKLVGFHPTFSGTGLAFFRDRHGNRHRMWPAHSFARLAVMLEERAGEAGLPLAMVVDALPQDERHVRPLVEASGGAVTMLSAPPDFERYKGLLSLLDVLVTPNTGPMHMAAALKTSLVALFSHWSPRDCGPYMESELFTVLQAEAFDQPEAGLAAIPPEAAFRAVWSYISEN